MSWCHPLLRKEKPHMRAMVLPEMRDRTVTLPAVKVTRKGRSGKDFQRLC